MPSYRRGRYRRRSNRKYSVGMIKSVARKIIDSRLETKDRTHQISFGSIVSGALNANCLTAIARGSGENERESDRIRVMELHFEGYCGVESEPCFIRLAIVWVNYEVDTGATMPAPTIGALWDLSGTDGTWGPRNLEQITNFCVIWERRVFLNQNTSYMAPVKVLLKLDHIVHYHSFGTADGSRGSLYFVATSDSVSSPHPAMDGVMRVRFKDD